jgi:HD superfamily phosphohydrolase YqeK
VSAVPPIVLPSWAEVGPKRLAHIMRVTALLDSWSAALRLSPTEQEAWHDAGRLHDALRDAPVETLRAIGEPLGLPPEAWHGPAAAARLRAEGESRESVLQAIAWHTVGSAQWDATGRALYCADFLEPGRRADAERRAELAAAFPRDPQGVVRVVAQMRASWAAQAGLPVHPATVAFLAGL